MTKIDYEARVAKGIALLDEKFPDWAGLIDLETLDIQNGSRCVTAQLAGAKRSFPDYAVGMRMLDLDNSLQDNTGSYTEHGFNAESEEWQGRPAGYEQATAYDTLNAIWQREISARQAASDAAS